MKETEALMDGKDNDDYAKVFPLPNETDKCKEGEFTPPEGGWGWLVCFTSFFTNGTIFGILNTFGILFEKIEEEYNQPASKTAMVSSFQIFMTFFLSPVASVLVDRIGIRTTAFSGAAIATV